MRYFFTTWKWRISLAFALTLPISNTTDEGTCSFTVLLLLVS